MYQINYLLSVEENLLRLANTQYKPSSGTVMSVGDFTHGNPTVITPTEGNDQSNTQLVLSGVPGRNRYGDVTVQYQRFTLVNNRPSAGDTLEIGNGESHESIHAKILVRWRLIASEVTFTNPSRVPLGGEAQSYILNPVANSSAYIPGTMTVQVSNIDEPVGPFDPGFLFSVFEGNDATTQRPIYRTRDCTLVEFGDSAKTSKQCFADYLNTVVEKSLGEFSFKDSNFTVQQIKDDTADAHFLSRTWIEPVASSDCPVVSGFFLHYNRDAFRGLSTAFSTHTGCPPSLMNLSSTADFKAEMIRVFKIPTDVMISGVDLLSGTAANRGLRCIVGQGPIIWSPDTNASGVIHFTP